MHHSKAEVMVYLSLNRDTETDTATYPTCAHINSAKGASRTFTVFWSKYTSPKID